MRIWLWRQKPPREQWVLKIQHETPDGTVLVRTWFDEYGPSYPPPPCVTIPVALACASIARAALASEITRYQVTLNQNERT